MKWITHKTAALGAAWCLGFPLPAVVAALAGAILPDLLDMWLARLLVFRQAAFNRLHRGITHWFGWWLAMLIPFVLRMGRAEPLPDPVWLVAGLGLGGLSHVLLDMCTMSGVPVAPWTRNPRVALKWCSTGSLREYVFLACMLIAFAFLARERLAELLVAAKSTWAALVL